jgi:hypothetical protein
MNEQAEAFFAEVKDAFQFLEHQYGYKRLEERVEHPNSWRDAAAKCAYAGFRVGVKVWWYFTDAELGVSFVEFQQPGTFPELSSLFRLTNPRVARAINLEDLAEVRGGRGDPDFLLRAKGKRRSLKRLQEQIETQRQEIVAGLARATRTYATDILQGDTSIFSEVMDYRLAKEKRLYPHLYIPGLKQQGESDQQ